MNDIRTADLFCRTERLVGSDAMRRLEEARVLLFGVGGVGSWCAEALIRSGIGHLTMVDPDNVDPSNINRQLPALTTTLGRPKVVVMRERLQEINPAADIVALQQRFSAENAPSFHLEEFDYVIDAIDSMADKMELILLCTQKLLSTTNYQLPTFYSSMGAARKMDPRQVRVSEFWKVDGCPLAASLRKRMRRAVRYPERKFQCVWSPERNETAQTGGTLMPVTATFGIMLASLVLQDLV
ncbi:MAG: tRNA threonylcarbamoyladenosine dehydratase [Bacteroidales bacterium]|nr:tRNA threonylcarbamoyladenosine dehydratase [Bacteroidales bacterium]